MTTYRAFVVNAQKHIQDKHEFEAQDDDEAVFAAGQWANGHLIEVWRAGIFVGTVNAKTSHT